MAREPTTRVFGANEASEVAHLVVDHAPELRRTIAFIPADQAAADAGVTALVNRLNSLPPSILSALNRAGQSAAHLSDDRLQGLAELIQNADDLGASEATIAIDGTSSRLLFSHNGASLTLHDVWALAIPWLSLKGSSDEQLGRFGIGLKTLHALSDVLEVNQGHFRVHFSPNTIQPLEDSIGWPGSDRSLTTFAIPFAPGAVSRDDAVKWLEHWDDAGLVFLRHLTSVRLIDEAGREIFRLRLKYGPEEVLTLDGDRTTRRRVTAADGRQWLVYKRSAPSPEGAARAGKAQGARTPLSFAFALFEGDSGHIHVGLPVRDIGLPFRMLAQFDPQPSRRDIADTDWNLALIPLLSDLWLDAALDLFRLAPAKGWAIVPTRAAFEAGSRTSSRLHAHLEEHLLQRARVEFAEALTFVDAGSTYPLNELAYETAELTSVLSPDDVRRVSELPGVLTNEVRSEDNRWRMVLDDLRDVGATTPTVVGIEEASTLLDDGQRSPEFVADLLAVLVEAGLGAALDSRACLVLDDGGRVPPRSRKGMAVLLPANPDPVWELLGMGARLHPAYTGQGRWTVIRDWLHERRWLRSAATSADALAVLADAGRAGIVLKSPLTDAQIIGLRQALEAIPDSERAALGTGIGKAVKVNAFMYDAAGARTQTSARPCEAYIIEREARTWFVAAGKTPGLAWIDRRYSEKIRADGREGIGAQRLFRLLGAEVAPRVEIHPENKRRFLHLPAGVHHGAWQSPARRNHQLQQHHATYTLQDWIAPDLDAVLQNISEEKGADQRWRRADAVLAALSRAWDRLNEYVTVEAAADYRRWDYRGQIDSWWISSAASIAWLPSEKGTATAPDQLRTKSLATVALYGDDPERYLAPALDTDAYRDVLACIGVAGDPTASELVQKLEDVRAETSAAPEVAEDLAAPLYQALAARLRGNRFGGQAARSTRTAFNRGDGLIATRNGWRRPSVVLAGPPIFGDMRDFVPSVSGTDALWGLLGIQSPTPQHAREVLGELARKKALTSGEKVIMLDSLRLLAGAPESELAKLRKAAVWVGDRWERKRPVYTTPNPLIAQALKGRVPIWSPGGALPQLEPLVDAYKLGRLDALRGQVLDAEAASYDADLTQIFATAVTNLRSDLALSDPQTERSLRNSWDELAALRVKQAPRLRVRLSELTYGLDETVEVDTWLDLPGGTFYISDEGAIGSPSSGAYAIASVFDGDARRIAHDWVAAWAVAREGHREETITTPARLDAERKKAHDERHEEALRNLAEQGKNRRSKSGGTAQQKPGKRGAPGTATQPIPQPTRHLIDPESLTLKNEDGEIVGGTSVEDVKRSGKRATTSSGKTRDPDKLDPRKPSSNAARGAKNYTDEERETVGLDLVRRVLGGEEAGIVDIRHQRNVGADAIDDLENFFELKVHAGMIPETVLLTSSEFRRAQETEQFFLVVVGNVEQSDKAPEILIFTDPLNHLKVLPQGSVHLGGIRDAKALRYTFEP